MRKALPALAAVLVLAATVLLVVLLVDALGEAAVSTERWTDLAALAAGVLGGLLALVAWRAADRHAERRAEEARDRQREEDERLRREELAEAERAREAALAEADRRRREEVDEATLRAQEAERRRGEEVAEAERRREAEIASLRAQAEDAFAAEQREQAERVRSERDLRERVVAAARSEREWNRELRRQVMQLAQRQGSLGDWSDVRVLVLRMAMAITEAEKGMLLTRTGADGALDLVAHHGFERDPQRSALGRRFAHAVLRADETVREDEPRETPEGDDSAADREIRNLLAIPIYVAERFSGVVVCANRDGGFAELDDDVLLALGDHAAAVLQNERLHDELRGSYVSTVQMLAEAIQAKDPFLRGHSEEVSEYVGAVARRLDVPDVRREELIFGSLLHDVGKIGISERILHKPGRLTAEEFAIIQLHPRIGYRLIEQVPSLSAIAPAILHHHERFDGGGYPSGLKGEQIPLEARVVCVADAFSAMTADRPYRSRMPMEEACLELERHAGTQFDPEIVRVFVEEVRGRPLSEAEGPLADALADAELQLHRTPEEPVLGAGATALTDSLTLLYTHRYVHEAAASEAERCRLQQGTFSIVLVQLDEVPAINRAQGFAAGDGHLRAAARVVSRLAVRHGATAARENGIVLALLVPRDREVDPDALGEEVRQALRDFGSVRVATTSWRPGDDGEAVLTRARAALASSALAVEP